jgi:hypothetical protein
LESRDFVSVGILEIDGLSSDVSTNVAVVLKESSGALNVLHLNESLVLSLEKQDIGHGAEGAGQGDDVLFGSIWGKTTTMKGLGNCVYGVSATVLQFGFLADCLVSNSFVVELVLGSLVRECVLWISTIESDSYGKRRIIIITRNSIK